MSIRVLFCSKSYPIYGGVERWLADLCTNLPDYGFRPIVALAKGASFHKPEQYLKAYPELQKLESFAIDGASGIAIGRRMAIERIIREVRPDIIVPVLLQDALAAAVVRRIKGADLRIVYPVHENDVWVVNAILPFKSQIDMVVPVNRLFVDLLEQLLDWPRDRIRHVRCGAKRPVLSRNERTDDLLRIGYCGKLVQKQKRVFDLVGLCNSLQRLDQAYKLMIVGSGNQEVALREQLAEEIARGTVVMLGQLSHDELYDLFYPNLDVLIITSYWETGPISAWEAMLNGVVVISSAYRGLSRENVLKHNQNALIFPIGDMQEAARCIRELKEEKALFRRISMAGRSTAENCLTISHMVEGWVHLLKETMSRPARKPQTVEVDYRCKSFRECWGLPPKVSEFIRKIAGRRYHHSSSHAEWPRYTAGNTPKNAELAFDRVLNDLEKELSRFDAEYAHVKARAT